MVRKQKESGGTVAIYLTGEAYDIYKRGKGREFAHGFGDWLISTQGSNSMAIPSDTLAHVLSPFYSGSLIDAEERIRLDDWISPESTDRVVLMGTTMAGLLNEHHPFLQTFLKKGGRLYVLLQGQLGVEDDKLVYTQFKEDIGKVREKRKASLEILSQLNKSAPEGSLLVRNSGNTLLTYSAILVHKKQAGEVDVQIQPYQSFPEAEGVESPRFFVRTNENNYTYALLAAPIHKLWDKRLNEELPS